MRIVYTGAGGVDVGSAPGAIASYRGNAGSTAEVPEDVGAILLELGAAKPAEAEPRKPASSKPARVARR